MTASDKRVGSIAVRALVLCDNIRSECDGAQSYMGCKNGPWRFESRSGILHLGAAIAYSPMAVGHVDIEVILSGDSLNESISLEGAVDVKRLSSISSYELHFSPIGNLMLPVDRWGTLQIDVRQNGGEPITIRKVRLKKPVSSEVTR